jgi:head-tail adaptor
MRVPIGDFRFTMEFLDFVRSDDGEGGFDASAAMQLAASAAVRPASAREIDAAGRLQQQISHVSHVRWRPDFEPRQGQAVRWTDRRGAVRVAYVVSARDPDERGRFVEMQLREGGPVKGLPT